MKILIPPSEGKSKENTSNIAFGKTEFLYKNEIIKVLEKTELVIVDLEVNLGNEKRNGLTLCVKYNGDYYPLNTAHDGRPILMNKDNIIKN